MQDAPRVPRPRLLRLGSCRAGAFTWSRHRAARATSRFVPLVHFSIRFRQHLLPVLLFPERSHALLKLCLA